MNRNTTLALAIAALGMGSAQADVLDLNKLVAERLQKGGKLATIYQRQTGQALPAGVSPSVAFVGEVGGKGLKISIPAMIPERPLVLMTKPVSCSPVDVTYNMGVDQTTTVSTTFSSTDTVETKKELSATVSYESPFGASASMTASFSQTNGTSMTRGGGKETAFKWADSQTFTAPANKAYKVQYVVTERYVDRVPYTANFVLSGDTEITFLQGQAGFSWVKVAGTSLPANVIRPGAQQSNRPLAVCRTYQYNRWRIGKSEGTTCWYGIHELAAMPFGPKSGASTGDFDILVGSPQQIQFGDPYAADAFTSTPQGSTESQKVCFAQHNGWSLPGYIEGRNCVSEWGSTAIVTQNYKVLRTPVSGGAVAKFKLQDYLSEAERTFDLRGVFTDVNQVEGGFRVDAGAPCPAAKTTTASAGGKTSAASAGPSLTAAKGPPEKKTLVLDRAAPNTPVIPASGKIGAPKKPVVVAGGK